MTLSGLSILAGANAARSPDLFNAFNPVTQTSLEPAFYDATLDQVNHALSEARNAQDAFAAFPANERAHFLDAIAAEIEKLGEILLDRCHAETGLPLLRLQGERARTCGQLRLFANVVREGSWVDARIDPPLPNRTPLPRSDIRRMLHAIGPIAVFGASNFPLAFSAAGGDTAAALAAGCPVIFKAHPAHPGTCELVAHAINRAAAATGMPPAVFSMVHGGPLVSEALVRHPTLCGVAFTGSHRVGRRLFDLAAARHQPIPVFAEMSSVNPVVLLPRIIAEQGLALVQGLVCSFTLGTGQFCTKPGLAFLVDGPGTALFLDEMRGALSAAPAGAMLTPAIQKNFWSGIEDILKNKSLELLVPYSTSGLNTDKARPIAACLTGAQFLQSPEVAHEIFGPFVLLVLVACREELASCLNLLEGQLTATVHGTKEDLAEYSNLILSFRKFAGRLVVNSFPTGVEVSPAMHHGGPYPATTDVRFTSVGTAAIVRFARPICYQNFPASLLPEELKDQNPTRILRLVDGRPTREPLGSHHAAI